jgi:hypothetical protein
MKCIKSVQKMGSLFRLHLGTESLPKQKDIQSLRGSRPRTGTAFMTLSSGTSFTVERQAFQVFSSA